MKKIMFNDRFGLTQAVIDGRKTMTRRIIKGKCFWERCPEGMWTSDEIKAWEKECEQRLIDLSQTEEWGKAKEWAISHIANYKIGEVVAVAQAYGSDDFCKHIPLLHGVKIGTKEEAALIGNYKSLKGFNNKMFVRAELMPYKIEITNIKIERMHDISKEDCMKEGILKSNEELIIGYPFGIPFNYYFEQNEEGKRYTTAQEAFSALIDKVSGNGTWENNPYCFCYEFKLIK